MQIICLGVNRSSIYWDRLTEGYNSVDSSSLQTEVMWRVVLTVSLLCWDLCSSVITCKDKNGGEVDWYILYKVPKMNNKKLTGLKFLYINSAGSEWHEDISNQNGALAQTLEPLFGWKAPMPDFGFISYSDQAPGCNAEMKYGHSKGIVMMDKTTGVWLLHSTPRFPDDRKHGKLWPDSGMKNAQTFICVTFKYAQFKEIGEHLQYIRALPFDYDIPDGFHQELHSVVKRENLKPTNKPFLSQELTSRAGEKFKSFAKYSSNLKKEKETVDDLYLLIADELKSNLRAQFWGEKGTGSKKHTFAVDTITCIKVKEDSWEKGCDHSKWSVTEDQNKAWTCIADMNREASQFARPGGALCIGHEAVWKAFRDFISEDKQCPPNKKPKIGDCGGDDHDDEESIIPFRL